MYVDVFLVDVCTRYDMSFVGTVVVKKALSGECVAVWHQHMCFLASARSRRRGELDNTWTGGGGGEVRGWGWDSGTGRGEWNLSSGLWRLESRGQLSATRGHKLSGAGYK